MAVYKNCPRIDAKAICQKTQFRQVVFIYLALLTGEKEALDKVSRSIMHVASVKAMKRIGGPMHGWICGTYANSVEKALIKKIRHGFTREDLQFIVDHLPTGTAEEEAESFALTDSNEQALCDELSAKLNALIPRLHVNRLYSDFFNG